MSARSLIWRSRVVIAATLVLAGLGTAAAAQVQFGLGVSLPGVRIGINVPAYPQLLPVPGYPVYYAPDLDANLFFYDGLYWVYTGDEWYSSTWYDGPWYLVQPEMVPDFILRIPILYYRAPPPYFLHWNRGAPPRWAERWGPRWEHSRPGWDRWDRHQMPPRAPLPQYQRGYSRGRYPDPARQRALENRYYPYRPEDRRDRNRAPVPRQFGPGPNQPPRAGRPEYRRPESARGAAPSQAGRPPAQRPGASAPGSRAPWGNRPPGGSAPPRERGGPQQHGSREKQPPERRGNREEERARRGGPPL